MDRPETDPPDIGYHRRVVEEFRAHGGRAGGWFQGVPLLLLHHTGARSGASRITPLVYQDLGGAIAIFGTDSGASHHPGWYHNLKVWPAAEVEIGVGNGTITTRKVTARTAGTAERREIWERQKKIAPVFADYESRTDRQIPVVILDPAG